ncbi:MAG: acylphosphatase, partial [Desulfatirhabdiaceae bacterium]
MTPSRPDAIDLAVRGIVQGVGFRPFVYQTAGQFELNGSVINTSDGVQI